MTLPQEKNAAGATVLIAGVDDPRFADAMRDLTPVEQEPGSSRGLFGRDYFPAVFGDSAIDRSFAVLTGSRPCLVVRCMEIGDAVDFYGMPCLIKTSGEMPQKLLRAVLRAAADYLRQTTRHAKYWLIQEPIGESASPVGEFLLSEGAAPSVVPQAVVDLSLSTDEIYRHVRKSYRSLINWGRKNISLSYVNDETTDGVEFDAFQAFHHQVAGKVTRSQESWDVMYEHVCRGNGELSLGRLDDGSLVSAVLLMQGRTDVVYSSGVFDRTKFDKPLAHWPVYNALVRAKERGKVICTLGPVPSGANATKTELDIAQFKRGLATRIDLSLHWRVPLDR